MNNDVKCDYYIRGHKIGAPATSIKIMMLLHYSCRQKTMLPETMQKEIRIRNASDRH